MAKQGGTMKAVARAGLHVHPTAHKEIRSQPRLNYRNRDGEKGGFPKENQVPLPGERKRLLNSQKQQMSTRTKETASKEEEHMLSVGARGLRAH